MVQRFDVGARMSEMAVHNGVCYLAGQVAVGGSKGISGQTRPLLGLLKLSVEELAAAFGIAAAAPLEALAQRRRAEPEANPQFQQQAQNAMRAGMLRPHIDNVLLVFLKFCYYLGFFAHSIEWDW